MFSQFVNGMVHCLLWQVTYSPWSVRNAKLSEHTLKENKRKMSEGIVRRSLQRGALREDGDEGA